MADLRVMKYSVVLGYVIVGAMATDLSRDKGVLRLYSATPPATPETAFGGSLLCEIELPSTGAFGTPAGATVSKGTAAWSAVVDLG